MCGNDEVKNQHNHPLNTASKQQQLAEHFTSLCITTFHPSISIYIVKSRHDWNTIPARKERLELWALTLESSLDRMHSGFTIAFLAKRNDREDFRLQPRHTAIK